MDKQFFREVFGNLVLNILPYWTEMLDPKGGFYGKRDSNNVIDTSAVRGAILNARILWAFSAVYRIFYNDKFLAVATHAKREIIDRFYDKEYGGIFWSLNPDGSPLDTRKQFYAIGFAIYGLSEYARATGDEEARDYALRLFNDIEQHSRDRVNGGYFEAMTRDWRPIQDMRLSEKDDNACKTMNTHLHIIEPYTNLLRVVPDNQKLYDATLDLFNIFIDKIEASGKRGHLGLFFDEYWHRKDDMISYGHDIEASWLLYETALVLNREDVLQRARKETLRIALAALEGRCSDGSMVYERHPSGAYDNDKHWWVQAECVIGQIYLYYYHDMPDMLEKAFQSWRYIADNIVDEEHGEWFWRRRADGSTGSDEKAGFWKCPYHNTRMCIEVLRHLCDFIN